MSTQIIPNVDYEKIDRRYDGRWVVIRVGRDQHVIADGVSAVEAIAAGVAMTVRF